jgi:hypothetical protein
MPGLGRPEGQEPSMVATNGVASNNQQSRNNCLFRSHAATPSSAPEKTTRKLG